MGEAGLGDRGGLCSSAPRGCDPGASLHSGGGFFGPASRLLPPASRVPPPFSLLLPLAERICYRLAPAARDGQILSLCAPPISTKFLACRWTRR